MFSYLPISSGPITLRKLSPDDVMAFHEYRSDPDVARFQGWSPMSIHQAANFLASQSRHAHLIPGAWHQIAIALATEDTLVGDIGVWISDDQRQAEFGLSINPRRQGEGFGTAAVRSLIALLFSSTPVSEIIASIDIRNVACRVLLARCGMRYTSTSTAEYKGEVCTEHCFAITKGNHQAWAPD